MAYQIFLTLRVSLSLFLFQQIHTLSLYLVRWAGWRQGKARGRDWRDRRQTSRPRQRPAAAWRASRSGWGSGWSRREAVRSVFSWPAVGARLGAGNPARQWAALESHTPFLKLASVHPVVPCVGRLAARGKTLTKRFFFSLTDKTESICGGRTRGPGVSKN